MAGPARHNRRYAPLFYLPNVICYIRIALSFYGLYRVQSTLQNGGEGVTTLFPFVFAAGLDFVDGIAARKLGQCTALGVILDIVADNVLRTCSWIAVAVVNPKLVLLSAFVIALEWTTMLSTQMYSSSRGKHWKDSTVSELPRFVSIVLKDGFRNPYGAWIICSLFFCPLILVALSSDGMVGDDWKHTVGLLCRIFNLGRGASAVVEVYFIWRYVRSIL